MIWLTLTRQTGGSVTVNADYIVYILSHTGGAEVVLADDYTNLIVTETPGQIFACFPAA
jgi:hypothetical protein